MERTRPRARRARPAAIAGWLAAGALGLASSAEASFYTSGCASDTACTFQELLDGGTITAGFQRFASFAIEQDPGSLDWTRVVVTGRDDAGLDPGPAIEFFYDGGVATTGTDSLDVQFSYTITSLIPQWQPVANELELLAYSVTGEGRLEVDETLFDASRRAVGDTTVAADDAFDETRVLDTVQFAPQAGGLLVSNTLEIEGMNAADAAELGEYIQRFALQVVPEPGFAPALACSTGLLAMMKKRRSRNR
ncbi:MAG: hypothetical protein CL931_03350 [Deltaproteobacteria bacterium]|nr:hypothetical protein [Deltaproteobacteria bacterium]